MNFCSLLSPLRRRRRTDAGRWVCPVSKIWSGDEVFCCSELGGSPWVIIKSRVSMQRVLREGRRRKRCMSGKVVFGSFRFSLWR